MRLDSNHVREWFLYVRPARFGVAAVLVALAFAVSAPSQQPAVPATATPAQQTVSSASQPDQPPAQAQPAPAASMQEPSAAASEARPTTTAPAQPASSQSSEAGGATEEEIKRLLAGKTLYLRGGYLDDSLSFNENGKLISHSPQGSYTLCGVQIDKVRFTKHKVQLEGARYGLHFLGALPYEDPTTAVDRVRITPKKKNLRITIDREVVVKPKQKKEKQKGGKSAPAKPVSDSSALLASTSAESPDPPPAQATAAVGVPEPADAEQAKAEMAATPPEERPADPGSVTTTTSPAHAAKVLKNALDAIFAPGMDDRVMASLPDFWKLYYQAVAAKSDYRPKDPTVLRQNTVDSKARLLTTFEPGSNEFAQANGVAGMALYHTVIGSDGKPGEIAVARPIGFGLDENAVAAIRTAKFEPAVKDGKPVPVMLDLVVQFRIYSKRTAVTARPKTEQADAPAQPALPGPYSVQHPQ
jgi:TonB family protein